MSVNYRTKLLYGKNYAEISMRDELHIIFHGNNYEPPRARWGLFRQVKRDKDLHPVICPHCRKIGVQDHSKNHICQYCLGVGYLWEESWIKFYQWPGRGAASSSGGKKKYIDYGVLETNSHVIYLEIGFQPTVLDKLIQILLDDEGEPIKPIQRSHMYDIRAVDHYRLDNARTEYYRLLCNRQTVGFIGQPLNQFSPGDLRRP